ncbi:hypothetical protein BD310DRAFT_808559 [Dichomitus squalens]|uniref:Uncharacterized protein n=1 Tax=Dichomitus squalens TaxID=114155 RepID=A0A4Q9Q8M0_9APHY|nr:hypothetical protein BD310DRAFT_808559 [Dichomitus squalens]
MAKRPRVPTALHAELTEYSSLLRALRTSDTLDLVSQLTQPPPLSVSQASFADDVSLTDEEDDDDEDGEAVNELPCTETASQDAFSAVASSPTSHGDHPRHVTTSDKLKGKERDTWTRWPLLAGDVHVPEWGLLDEVKHIAEHVLAITNPNEQAAEERDEEEVTVAHAIASSGTSAIPVAEHEDDPALLELGIDALTADCAAFLTRVLALLAAHVPAAEKSMQNRIAPIKWETVVDVACAHGVASPRIAELVRERMSRLYPPAHPNITHRTQHLRAMKQGLSHVLAKHQNDLLAVPSRVPVRVEEPANHKGSRRVMRQRNASTEAEPEAGPAPKRQRAVDG